MSSFLCTIVSIDEPLHRITRFTVLAEIESLDLLFRCDAQAHDLVQDLQQHPCYRERIDDRCKNAYGLYAEERGVAEE